MNLQKRKIEFVKDFLSLQSKEALGRLEKLLKQEKEAINNRGFEPMTREILNNRISQSESDFNEGRFTDTKSLTSKFEE